MKNPKIEKKGSQKWKIERLDAALDNLSKAAADPAAYRIRVSCYLVNPLGDGDRQYADVTIDGRYVAPVLEAALASIKSLRADAMELAAMQEDK